ncbi:MAG: hypothetical protein HYZ75_19880 [Elusimicrobia bacterium]|nr:hypothetical protein [Elusimicrobiota bacterium]
MESKKEGRAADAVALVILAVMAASLFTRLQDFPGLHGDEAWVGLFALRLRERGLYTPHEMNTYTGALYPWLVKSAFGRWGVSVESLRLPGALFNVAAWLVLWRTAVRAAGPRAGLAWCALAASSAIVVLKSRVAWEVYALQPLLLGLCVAAALKVLDGGRRGPALLLFAASLIGVQNHFIFLSLPLALAGAAAALHAREGGERWLDLLQAALVNLGPCLILFAVKPLLTEASWPMLRVPLLAAFCLLPFAAVAALEAAPRWRAALAGLFVHPRAPEAAAWARRAFFALLAAAFWFHWVALIQIQSGVAVLARLASWRLPGFVEVLLYAWAALFLAAVLGRGVRRLDGAGSGESQAETLLAVLPVVYAAVFILFRNTSSIRYYILLSHLFLLAAAAAWPRLPPARRRPVLAAAAVGGVALHLMFWTALLSPSVHSPFRFRVGWHREKSYDFLPKEELFAEAQRRGVCEVVHGESMLDIPLIFDLHAHPRVCRGGTLATSYRGDGSSPPYIDARFTEPSN